MPEPSLIQGTLQFCVVKPVMAIAIIAMAATHAYGDGDLRPDRGYLYVALIYNTSITIALFALVLFYAATRDLLRLKPLLPPPREFRV
jgi:hypothetical protein